MGWISGACELPSNDYTHLVEPLSSEITDDEPGDTSVPQDGPSGASREDTPGALC